MNVQSHDNYSKKPRDNIQTRYPAQTQYLQKHDTLSNICLSLCKPTWLIFNWWAFRHRGETIARHSVTEGKNGKLVSIPSQRAKLENWQACRHSGLHWKIGEQSITEGQIKKQMAGISLQRANEKMCGHSVAEG